MNSQHAINLFVVRKVVFCQSLCLHSSCFVIPPLMNFMHPPPMLPSDSFKSEQWIGGIFKQYFYKRLQYETGCISMGTHWHLPRFAKKDEERSR